MDEDLELDCREEWSKMLLRKCSCLVNVIKEDYGYVPLAGAGDLKY